MYDRLNAAPLNVWGVTTVRLEEARGVIWLNRVAWPELPARVPRTLFTVAHELGHLALQAGELGELKVRAESEHSERMEREANRFAAELLVPDQALRRLPRMEADGLAKRFGVSLAMAARRREEFRSQA